MPKSTSRSKWFVFYTFKFDDPLIAIILSSFVDFSEEEDEFIMAEENNHAAADDDDIDQEDIRNLHIDGKCLKTLLNISTFFQVYSMDSFFLFR